MYFIYFKFVQLLHDKMRTKIKICGINTAKEAKYAIKHGADFLGILINIPLTNLSVSIYEAKKIIELNKSGKFILLLANKNLKEIIDIINYVKPWGVQLLRPSKKILESLKKRSHVKIIPVIHVMNRYAISKAIIYSKIANYLLLDTKFEKFLGGTGLVHDWSISKEIVKKSHVPVFLAGGLNKNNVLSAIHKVKPYSVDAESSLRNKKGYRDLKKIKEYINIIKNS